MHQPKAMQVFDVLEIGLSVDLDEADVSDDLHELDIPLHTFMNIPLTCPFCNSPLLNLGNFDLSAPEVICSSDGKAYYLWYCQHCRFWQWYYYFDEFTELTGDGCLPGPMQIACISKLRARRSFKSGHKRQNLVSSPV